jgi:uncharacterized tellurite resistance protein B-like protein
MIDPITAKIAVDAVKSASDYVGKKVTEEKATYKDLFISIKSISKETIKDVLLIAPKFLLLLPKLLRSKEVDSSVKLVFTGIIIVLSMLLGFAIWDISLITMLFTAGVFAGPLTVVALGISGTFILIIKASLTTFLVLISMQLCIMVFEDEEIKKQAIAAFGEEKGTDFYEKMTYLSRTMKNTTDKFIIPVKEFFIKVARVKGADKDKFSLADMEKKLQERITSKDKDLIILNSHKIEDAELSSIIFTLLRYIILIDGVIDPKEQEIVNNFLKEEYSLSNDDLDNFYELKIEVDDIELYLKRIKKELSSSDIDKLIMICEEIVIVDCKIDPKEIELLRVINNYLK